MTDEEAMGLALEEARAAAAAGEAPIGALILAPDGAILARARNAPIATHDPTAHAEILALRAAAQTLANYRLAPGLTLVVTLEPCAMCAGALSAARIARLVYGAPDAKGGAVAHGPRYFEQPTCHWRPSVTAGVRADESAALLRDFFRARR
jgi:tRNA(Arg) A34 adenosine deaminase TadA